MKVIYPPLVEQSYQFIIQQGIETTVLLQSFPKNLF